jgi:GTP 3',8-cyclase
MNGLIDSFGRKNTYLRISVTDRCNLRCIYCMPPEGIELRSRDEIMTFDEVERIAKIFVAMGINKIRLTGGEPLIRKSLTDLIARLSQISGVKILSMTTNGVLLSQYARELKSAGLTQLNVSLDTLRRDRFEQIALCQSFDKVMKGIDASLDAKFIPLKLNVVVMRGANDDELLDFVEFVRDRPINVRFIEYMPFKFNQWNHDSFIPCSIMQQQIQERYHLIPMKDEQKPFAVAKDFTIDGFLGMVSFITSMSDHFCEGCNRIRLTADGSVKSCLFYSAEINLKSALRGGASDEVLSDMIQCAVVLKPRVHPPLKELATLENQSMIEIGG